MKICCVLNKRKKEKSKDRKRKKIKNMRPVFEVIVFYSVFCALILSMLFTAKLLIELNEKEVGEKVAINYDIDGSGEFLL